MYGRNAADERFPPEHPQYLTRSLRFGAPFPRLLTEHVLSLKRKRFQTCQNCRCLPSQERMIHVFPNIFGGQGFDESWHVNTWK